MVARSNAETRDAVEEVWLDILKLRDAGDANAVPVLEEILASPWRGSCHKVRSYGGTTPWNTCRSKTAYAAAQALFCIDTAEAHETLRKHMLTSAFSAKDAISSALEFEMREPARTQFIEQYCLKNLSDDLKLDLDVEPRGVAAGGFTFTVSWRNTSDRAYRIMIPNIYEGRFLHFRSERGFVYQFAYELYDIGLIPEWVELAPGATHEETLSLFATRVDADDLRRTPDLSPDAELMGHLTGLAVDLVRPGTFTVYAMVEAPPLNEEQREKLGVENPWSGRAVSKPVTIEVAEPEE